MGKVTINGVPISFERKVSISEDEIWIDGKGVSLDSREIKVNIVGNLEELDVRCATSIDVNGNVTNIRSQAGDVGITGNILGNVQTISGNVVCHEGYIEGNVASISGDIRSFGGL